MSNSAAKEMYRRFGFGPVGVRKNYYQEVNEDALVMTVHDIDARGAVVGCECGPFVRALATADDEQPGAVNRREVDEVAGVGRHAVRQS